MSLVDNVLRRVLTASEPRAEPTPEEMMAAARHRRRAADAPRDRAKVALAEASAARQRVEAVIAAADTAEEAAQTAEDAAAASVRAWAARGAPADEAQGDPALLTAAADARRTAQFARLKADGAKAAVRQVREAELAAERDLNAAETEIYSASGQIELAEIESALRSVEAAFAAAAPAFALVAGFMSRVRYSRDGLGSVGLETNELRKRLGACVLAVPTDRDLEFLPAAEPWVDFGRRLLTDPEAKFEDAT